MIYQTTKTDNNQRSESRELRRFAITLFIALGIFGGLVLWRRGEIGLVFWGIGLGLFTVGLVRPKILGPVYRGWIAVAFLMGFVMTHFILALMYYLVFTPMGLVMRVLGRDPLRLEFDRNAKSYWIRRQPTEFIRERYEKMY